MFPTPPTAVIPATAGTQCTGHAALAALSDPAARQDRMAPCWWSVLSTGSLIAAVAASGMTPVGGGGRRGVGVDGELASTELPRIGLRGGVVLSVRQLDQHVGVAGGAGAAPA